MLKYLLINLTNLNTDVNITLLDHQNSYECSKDWLLKNKMSKLFATLLIILQYNYFVGTKFLDI